MVKTALMRLMSISLAKRWLAQHNTFNIFGLQRKWTWTEFLTLAKVHTILWNCWLQIGRTLCSKSFGFWMTSMLRHLGTGLKCFWLLVYYYCFARKWWKSHQIWSISECCVCARFRLRQMRFDSDDKTPSTTYGVPNVPRVYESQRDIVCVFHHVTFHKYLSEKSRKKRRKLFIFQIHSIVVKAGQIDRQNVWCGNGRTEKREKTKTPSSIVRIVTLHYNEHISMIWKNCENRQ